MNFLVGAIVILTSINVQAALSIQCKNKPSVPTDLKVQIQLDGTEASLQFVSGRKLIYKGLGHASHNEKWNSITIDATTDEFDGVKVYFESARSNDLVAIRPYGKTSEKLTGTKEIVVYGLNCNQSYASVLNEVLNY